MSSDPNTHHPSPLEEARAELADVEAMIGDAGPSGVAIAATVGPRRSALATLGWAGPGALWILVFLAAPMVMILATSFWRKTPTGFDAFSWTFDNYQRLFHTDVYRNVMFDTIKNTLIVLLICLLIGYPIAFFLAQCVTSIKTQIALFIIVLAPFWTAYVIRIIAWYPILGRQGAINYGLQKVGLISEPLDFLLFSNFAVIIALVQLYVLFMVTPIFFQLATIDKAAVEGARDLGATPFQVFREVILPLSLPGVLIGCIFVFVLVMGEFATVQIIGGGQIQSVGTIVRQYYINIDLPAAAAGSAILVLVMMAGVALLLRFAKIREAV